MAVANEILYVVAYREESTLGIFDFIFKKTFQTLIQRE